ncbi:MAG: tRNA-dihydrouridine synthase family protein [Desulfobacterales bacterium]|nr:MAG: tRNA-dihydrouridine synthase family protein [Desulfobacterales bacterium]
MIPELSRKLNQPLFIGQKTIQKRLVLSPMAFIGNVAFRELIATYGGYGLLFTEMCSAKRIPHENRHTSSYFRWRNEECSNLVCQIFGSDPKIMAEAARRIEKEGLFGVDINFGCSDVSICRQNCGAAILNDPDLATRIVAAVRKAVSIPLLVKFRAGWEDDPRPSIDLAQRFEDAGADALTFHPRQAPDRRTRPPKWEYIRNVKESVSIPVFGNGDVFDQNDCLNLLHFTGCDGVAIGRIAVARPWVFAEWTDDLVTQQDVFLESAIKLARLLEKHYEPPKAIRRFKRFAFYFSANFKFGHTLYTRILNTPDMRAVETVLHKFFKTIPEVIQRPNMNFFI